MAAFVAEPIVGATLGAVEPPAGYWPAIADVCRRHGVLLVADEVMTGFGRTGTWFAMDRYGVRPDLLVAAKGATSGYWPFGFVAASGEVWEAVTRGGGFVHGFTYSHQPGAAAVALRGAADPRGGAARRGIGDKGERLLALLRAARAATPTSATSGPRAARRRRARPGPRDEGAVPARSEAHRGGRPPARERGLLLYSGTGNANGIDGDVIVLGPPFVVTDDELARIADGIAEALDLALATMEVPASA